MDSCFWSFRQTPRDRGFILLEFYTLFKCFIMFGWIEALNGHLISPKTWDRIVVIFEAQIVQSVTEHGWFGLLDYALSNK